MEVLGAEVLGVVLGTGWVARELGSVLVGLVGLEARRFGRNACAAACRASAMAAAVGLSAQAAGWGRVVLPRS